MEAIAQAADVSRATVSYVLNNRAKEMGISKKTQERVLSFSNKLNYRCNFLARGLRIGHTHMLGLIVTDISNPFYAEIALGVETEAQKYNYKILLCNTLWQQAREVEYVRRLAQYQVDGLIITPIEKKDDHFLEFLDIGKPIVFIDTTIPAIETDYVINDNVAGAYMAVEHFIQLGHKRIGHISGSAEFSYFSSFRAIIEGYKQAHIDYHLPINENLIINGGLTIPDGRQAMWEFLKMEPPPTAIFAVNDMSALGAIAAINAAGLRVPEDIAVVGIDDIEVASLPSVALTTISQPKLEIGRKAVEILINKNPERVDLQQFSLKPRLVLRHSCGYNINKRKKETMG